MRKSIYMVAVLGLGVGFAIAWFVKPNNGESQLNSVLEVGQEPKDDIWTCSMHPQIRSNEPGKCPICEMDLIPLNSTPNDNPYVLEMTPQAVELLNIQTFVVGNSGSNTRPFVLSGKIQEDERRAENQVAHIPGRIEKLFVTFTGEQVKQGQKLAIIYSPDLISAQRELIEAIKIKETYPDLYYAAKRKLHLWKIPEDQILEIEKSGEIRETFILFAEANGIVKQRRIAVGDYVSRGQVLFDMLNLEKVWVIFDVYEEELSLIELGNQIEFTTPALPGITFTASISFIDPLINPKTRVATIRGEVNNKHEMLKPEMFVKGTLKGNQKVNDKLIVPKTAVLWTGERSVVYVNLPGHDIPTFEFREVELGAQAGSNYEVLSGLASGEKVVSYGSFSLDAAAQLNNQASMMNRKVKLKGGGQHPNLPDYSDETSVEFKRQLTQLVAKYITLKEALVSTDYDSAKDAANLLISGLDKIDMGLIKGDAHIYWMEKYKELNSHIQGVLDGDTIESQRTQFDFLSRQLVQSVKVFGVVDQTYYIQHCPMAFDNEGADWISEDKDIANPYFGDKMLKCGKITDTIK